MSNFQHPAHALRFLDFTDLRERSRLGKTKLYEEIKFGRLRPIKLGRKTVFLESEVNDWIRDRVAESRNVASI